MKLRKLRAELIKNNDVIDECFMSFEDTKTFFIALVTICDRFNIEIPIWKIREDKILDQKKEILIPMENNLKLLLSLEEK